MHGRGAAGSERSLGRVRREKRDKGKEDRERGASRMLFLLSSDGTKERAGRGGRREEGGWRGRACRNVIQVLLEDAMHSR